MTSMDFLSGYPWVLARDENKRYLGRSNTANHIYTPRTLMMLDYYKGQMQDKAGEPRLLLSNVLSTELTF
jgi:hypothetical protein